MLELRLRISQSGIGPCTSESKTGRVHELVTKPTSAVKYLHTSGSADDLAHQPTSPPPTSPVGGARAAKLDTCP